jgi:signal transduction histidine kinase
VTKRLAALDADAAVRALAEPASEPAQLAELCRAALDVDAVIFWTRRGTTLSTFAIAPSAFDEVSLDMRVGEGVAGRVAESGEAIILADMLDDEELSTRGLNLRHPPVIEEHGWRGGMFIPVSSGLRMVGVFGAFSTSIGGLREGLQEHVFGAFANRVASELHRYAITEEFDRVTALGLAAIDRAHTLDNTVFALQGSVTRLQTLYNRRLRAQPELGTPEIRRTIATIAAQSSQVGSNFEALIHEDRLRRSSKSRVQPIAPILAAVVARHGANAEDGSVDIVAEVDANVVAFVRAHDLERVIDNLVVNALHFLKWGTAKPRYIAISAKQTDTPQRTKIIVEDNGEGIPENELPYVFDLMWASPRHGGSGFGLFFAKRIIEAFGGSIEVQSRQQVLTRFIIELNR